MNIRILNFLLFFTGMIFLSPVQAQMEIDAEIRPRFEMRQGYKKLPADTSKAAWLTSQRSRIHFTYSSPKVKSRISIQDVRTWGEEKMRADEPSLGLYEAWAEIQLLDSLYAKAGRQELIYGNQRLLANVNWAQKGLIHDALVLRYQNQGFRVDLGTAFNQTGDPLFFTTNPILQKDGYKSLNFLWISHQYRHLEINLAAIRDGFQSLLDAEKVEHRNTLGSVVKGKFGDITLFLQAFYQNGNNQDGREISASYLNPEISYSISKKTHLTIGAEVFSGNDPGDGSDTKFKTFSTLYGSGHTFNGYMDYFTNMPDDTKSQGLMNPFIKSTFKLHPSLLFMVDAHIFFQKYWLDQTYIGSELDLSFRYNISHETQVLAGYSIMRGSENMESLKGGSHKEWAHWTVLMLTIRPTFFRSGK